MTKSQTTAIEQSEGDINRSSARRDWDRAQRDSRTRKMLADDARFFLHQGLSTPCLDALSGCRGMYLIACDGRRIMDFHGNSVHQVGYGNRRVLSAIRAELRRQPFSPRRFANETATRLTAKLSALAPGDLNRSLFAPSGTAAIGIALKLARCATGRHKTIRLTAIGWSILYFT